jgi:hypothetical protein
MSTENKKPEEKQDIKKNCKKKIRRLHLLKCFRSGLEKLEKGDSNDVYLAD